MKKSLLTILVFCLISIAYAEPLANPVLITGDTYKKEIIDAEGNYRIRYIPEVGKTQIVSKDQDLYKAWLAKGYTPEVIPYVAPPPPTPLTVEQKTAKVMRLITNKQDQAYDAGFTFNGKQYPSDLQYREFMATGVRLAKQAQDAETDIAINAITLDGSITSLSGPQLLALQSAYDIYCLGVYNLFILEMATLKQANEQMLDYYLANGVFE